MGNGIYNSFWKNEGLWKNIRNTSPFIAAFILFVGSFDQEIFLIYYQLPALVLFGIAAIADMLVENIDKEIHELKKYIFWRIIGVFILMSVLALISIFLPDYEKIFPITFLTFLVLIIIIEIFFKERLIKFNNIFKFLVNDEPPLFSKKYFEKTGKGTIFLNIAFILFIIVGLILLIGFEFFQW